MQVGTSANGYTQLMGTLALLMPGNFPCSLSFDYEFHPCYYDHHIHPVDLVDIFPSLPSLVFPCTLAVSSHPVPGLFLSIL